VTVRKVLLAFGFSVLAVGCTKSEDSVLSQASDAPESQEAPETPQDPIEIKDIDPSILAEGGYVLYFRHTTRDPDDPNSDMNYIDRNGICVVGSQLNATGEMEATKLGEVFRNNNFTVGHIYTSPSCRTKQMAQLAFGTLGEVVNWAARPPTWLDEEIDPMYTALKDHMAELPLAGTNTVILTHGSLYDSILKVNYRLLQGDAGVFKPYGDGTYDFVGLLRKEVWMGL